MANEQTPVASGYGRTRLFAFGALTAFLSVLGYVGNQGYHAATDSFVAPIILSPDNDAVISSKLKLTELTVEKAKTSAQIAAVDADVEASARALDRLHALHATTSHALAWTAQLTDRQGAAVTKELASLEKQRAALGDLLGKQASVTEQVRENARAGLVTKLDLAREEQATGRWRVALLETERSSLQAKLVLQEVAVARKSLAHGGPAMPEQIARDEQLVRIELESMKLEAEQRSKRAERKVLDDKLTAIVGIEKQLMTRPIFRALDRSLDVAFVPYTQIDGLERGASVYDCIWGIFHCHKVGTVSELVPGEVILPDPWGNQARGQYAVLDLDEQESARSKTLRVRPTVVPVRTAQKIVRSSTLATVE